MKGSLYVFPLLTASVITAAIIKTENKPIVLQLKSLNIPRDIQLNQINHAISNLNVKYVTAPPDKNGTATIYPVTQSLDSGFYASVSIGNPPQKMNLIIDTTRSDILVSSVGCKENCENKALYDAKSSNTSKSKGLTFKSLWGSDNITGDVYSDIVSIAEKVVLEQGIGAVTSIPTSSSFPKNSSGDGILGLGFVQTSNFTEKPFLTNLLNSHNISSAIIGIHNPYIQSFYTSQLTLGGINENLAGNPNYNTLTSTDYWQIALESVNVDENILVLTKPSHAIIDTETTLIAGPLEDVKKFYEKIPGSYPYADGPGYYVYPCKSNTTVNFKFNGTNYPFDMNYLNYVNLDQNSTNCVGAVVGINYDKWILGWRFLGKVYTILDMTKNRVGFTPLRQLTK